MNENGEVSSSPSPGVEHPSPGHSVSGALHRTWGKSIATLRYFSELRWVVLFGILVRICLWVYTSQADLSGFASQSVTMAYGGGPYTYGNNYPPAWDLLLSLIGRTAGLAVPPSGFLETAPLNAVLMRQIGQLEPLAIVTPVYSVVEKSFLLPFDLGTGLIIYYLVRTTARGRMRPRTAFALWFLNPLVVTISSMQGNYDVISAFFVLLALVLVLKSDPLFAGVAVGIAATLELYSLFLVPIFLAFLLRNQRRAVSVQRTAGFLAGGAAAGLVALWPPGILSQFISSFSGGPRVGQQFGGLWLWSVVSLPFPSVGEFSRALTANSVYVSLFGATAAAALVAFFAIRWALSRGFQSETTAMIYAMVASILSIYFVLPVVEPQNLIWVLPYLLLGCVTTRSFRVPFVAASTLPVAFSLVALGGPLYYLQGFAVFTNVLSAQTVVTSVTQFTSLYFVTFPLLMIPTFAALLLAFVHSVRLGRRQVVPS